MSDGILTSVNRSIGQYDCCIGEIGTRLWLEYGKGADDVVDVPPEREVPVRYKERCRSRPACLPEELDLLVPGDKALVYEQHCENVSIPGGGVRARGVKAVTNLPRRAGSIHR